MINLVTSNIKLNSQDTSSISQLSHNIKNLYCVNDYLYRGRQPGISHTDGNGNYVTDLDSMKKDIDFLKNNKNIKTIIDLRHKNYEGIYLDKEKEYAKLIGLNYVNIPMDSSVVPTGDQIFEILNSIEKLSQPVFVHCREGRDRTGMAILMHEVYKTGKYPYQAIKETFIDRDVMPFKYMSPENKYVMVKITEKLCKLGLKNNHDVDLLKKEDLKKIVENSKIEGSSISVYARI